MFYLSSWKFQYRGAGNKIKELIIKDVLVNTDDENIWKTDTYYIKSALKSKVNIHLKSSFNTFLNINTKNGLPMPISIELTYKCKSMEDGINFKQNVRKKESL